MNPHITQLVEQHSKRVIKDLFDPSFSPTPGNGFLLKTEEEKARFTELAEPLVEVYRSIFEKASPERKKQIEERISRIVKKKMLKEKESQYITEEDGEFINDQQGLKLAAMMEISKASKEKGRFLTEQEIKEIGRSLLENSLEGRTLTVLQEIRKDYPEAVAVGTYEDKIFFKDQDGIFGAGYHLKNGVVELSESTEMKFVLLPIDTIDAIDEAYNESLEEEKKFLRMAGVDAPEPSPEIVIDEASLTEQDKKYRKMAGISEPVVESAAEVNEGKLTPEEKRLRFMAGMSEYE